MSEEFKKQEQGEEAIDAQKSELEQEQGAYTEPERSEDESPVQVQVEVLNEEQEQAAREPSGEWQDDRAQGEEERVQEKPKDTAERIWDATRKTLTMATFKAGQYRRVVQKKIDLGSLHKKISAAHGDLGRIVDEAYENGESGILERGEIKQLLERLDEYKQNAAVIEHEIEMIKAEEPAEKTPQD